MIISKKATMVKKGKTPHTFKQCTGAEASVLRQFNFEGIGPPEHVKIVCKSRSCVSSSQSDLCQVFAWNCVKLACRTCVSAAIAPSLLCLSTPMLSGIVHAGVKKTAPLPC